MVLGESKIYQTLKHVIALSKADQTEALLLVHDSALTRFANNTIHQNVAEVDASLTIRVALGSRVGVASTNDLSENGLARAVENAQAIARLQPEKPDFPGLPQPRPVDPAPAFDPAVAEASPAWRARAVGSVCVQAHAHGLNAAGALTTSSRELAVVNSQGVAAYHVATQVDLTTVVRADSGSGYAARSAWRLNDVDIEKLGQEAIQTALRSRSPRSIEAGDYPVILMPYATLDIVGSLAYVGMGAQSVQESRSWMNGRIGQPLMSPGVNIWDDGCDPAGLPLPFDFEGVPKRRVDIVTAGVPQGPVYDSLTASREPGKVSSGHALPAPNVYGPYPSNLVMGSGDSTLDDMLRSTERGLLVTRFWYTRVVHPRDCVITGMTRDGLFLVKDGEIAYPVKNLRFTQGYVPALAAVESVGRELWTVGEDLGAARVPALKLGAFTFTGTTEF